MSRYWYTVLNLITIQDGLRISKHAWIIIMATAYLCLITATPGPTTTLLTTTMPVQTTRTVLAGKTGNYCCQVIV